LIGCLALSLSLGWMLYSGKKIYSYRQGEIPIRRAYEWLVAILRLRSGNPLDEDRETNQVDTVFKTACDQLDYFSIFTPFQKTTYPLIWRAAGWGSG